MKLEKDKRNKLILRGSFVLLGLYGLYRLGSKFNGGGLFDENDLFGSETADKYGINNKPSPKVIRIANKFVKEFLIPLTDLLGYVPYKSDNSWFRTDQLTFAIYHENPNGQKSSKHNEGGTMDLDSPGNTNNHEITYTILKHNLPFNQMILEEGTITRPGWIHLSWLPGENKRQVGRIKNKVYTTLKETDLRAIYHL